MYRGFNLSCDTQQFLSLKELAESGQALFESNKIAVSAALKTYTELDGRLNGSKLQEEWFPLIKADVFISHSHHDKKQALIIAGWLSLLGLKVFIDSAIWLNGEDLLRQIDDKFCLNDGGQTYNYNKRNLSTSHVHMILMTALSRMIYNTECLIFLNTPNSICVSEQIETTSSPWIFAELNLSSILKLKSKADHRHTLLKANETRMLSETLEIDYTANLNHLTDLTAEDLKNWVKEYRRNNNKYDHSLDALYEIKPRKIKANLG